VGQDFGIGLRPEDHPGLGQLLLEALIVFDNAVMGDNHIPILVPVRRGILFSGFPVICYLKLRKDLLDI